MPSIHRAGRPNPALEQARDSVLRYGESIGCKPLSFSVRQIEVKGKWNNKMFSAACVVYDPLVCRVGGGSSTVRGKLFGSGCLISPTFVLTASHVIRQLPSTLNRIVVVKYDGLFRCEVAWESQDLDLALLATTELLEPSESNAPTEYPVLPSRMPQRGMSVGYIARLHLPDSSIATYFAQAAVSMFVTGCAEKGARFMLSDGIVQSGFSGSAVFDADRVLHGVVVQSFQFPVESGHMTVPLHTRPVMVCVGSVLGDIKRAANL